MKCGTESECDECIGQGLLRIITMDSHITLKTPYMHINVPKLQCHRHINADAAMPESHMGDSSLSVHFSLL